jgi:hypothetical protein
MKAIGDELGTAAVLARLRRHVGHTLRCSRETSGDVAGYVVETVALRCDDCNEIVLEAIQRLLARARR